MELVKEKIDKIAQILDNFQNVQFGQYVPLAKLKPTFNYGMPQAVDGLGPTGGYRGMGGRY